MFRSRLSSRKQTGRRLMLSTKLFLVAAVLLLSQPLRAQTNSPVRPEAYKFAEFSKISNSDLCPRILAFYGEVKRRRDTDLQGYIINYGTPGAIRSRRNSITRCIPFRDYDPARIT